MSLSQILISTHLTQSTFSISPEVASLVVSSPLFGSAPHNLVWRKRKQFDGTFYVDNDDFMDEGGGKDSARQHLSVAGPAARANLITGNVFSRF